MILGIIREGKIPADSRVVLNPNQCKAIEEEFPDIKVLVQSSDIRCFKDEEYLAAGIEVVEQIDMADVLLGVKEVPIDQLIPDKTYFFFSHTIKEQEYNRDLLRSIMKYNIRLIDYECLTNERGTRLIAFGRWAGIVGAHNGLYVYGRKTNAFDWKRAFEFKDYSELIEFYKTTKLPAIKIAITGGGRVAMGAIEIMDHLDVRRVRHSDFIDNDYDEAVYVQLDCEDLYRRIDDGGFEIPEFYQDPGIYKSTFQPYLSKIDLFINAIYWDPKAPAYFKLEDIEREDEFSIKVISDITCDIAPVSSVPITYRATSIKECAMGIDRSTKQEVEPYQKGSIDLMSIDHLPNELPRDSSTAFGEMFLKHILKEIGNESSEILDRATIAKDGHLNTPFNYLKDYVNG